MPHREIGCILGVFDLFHIGQLDQLLLAASRYDALVVALPTDDLMESLTGQRPFVPQTERAEILAAVRSVARVELVDSFDLTDLVLSTGARAVLLPVEAQQDGLADDVLVPAGVQVIELEHRRTTRSGTVLSALRRKSGRSDLGSNVA